MTTSATDRIGDVENTGFTTAWDWKGEYMSHLAEDSYERFSQFSATPDSTALFAGPARFNGLSGSVSLLPIGLVDGIQLSQSAQLAQLFEIGSNRSFFTRGKSANSVTFQKMLADQKNILTALTTHSYRPTLNASGQTAPTAETTPDVAMNLDSEFFNVPFGLMLLFKTRGGGDGTGKILSCVYLEYCMFQNYGFAVASSAPSIAESISIQFDRVVPVAFN